jgi:hypothetical protein
VGAVILGDLFLLWLLFGFFRGSESRILVVGYRLWSAKMAGVGRSFAGGSNSSGIWRVRLGIYVEWSTGRNKEIRKGAHNGIHSPGSQCPCPLRLTSVAHQRHLPQWGPKLVSERPTVTADWGSIRLFRRMILSDHLRSTADGYINDQPASNDITTSPAAVIISRNRGLTFPSKRKRKRKRVEVERSDKSGDTQTRPLPIVHCPLFFVSCHNPLFARRVSAGIRLRFRW